ncbi:hypothetical protein ZWY2020_017814 [Hordeum vulgare]|nr:hypothetical protein ZWY2020_017814 [Hordeum vulgare]
MWKRWCSRTAAVPSPEPLPVDLLLEILVRADVKTIVRCAAAGRILRRGILEPAFRRTLTTHNHGGFDPALLLGVSYLEHSCFATHRVIHTPGLTKLAAHLEDLIFSGGRGFTVVASRGSLIVLCCPNQGPQHKLWLCDALTGHVTTLPAASLPDVYLHAVLSVGDADHSFELLVADKSLQFHQTFSSTDSQWSVIHQVSIPRQDKYFGSYCSAVIGRTVYWPWHWHVHSISYWDHVLALDLDERKATMIKLPRCCFSRMAAAKRNEHLHLASVRGRLCLLVAEICGIAMWTSTLPVSAAAAATWSRQLMINTMEIGRQVGFSPYHYALVPFDIEGFGERSGAVILSQRRLDLNTGELLRLDLGTMEETYARRHESQWPWKRTADRALVLARESSLAMELRSYTCRTSTESPEDERVRIPQLYHADTICLSLNPEATDMVEEGKVLMELWLLASYNMVNPEAADMV